MRQIFDHISATKITTNQHPTPARIARSGTREPWTGRIRLLMLIAVLLQRFNYVLSGNVPKLNRNCSANLNQSIIDNVNTSMDITQIFFVDHFHITPKPNKTQCPSQRSLRRLLASRNLTQPGERKVLPRGSRFLIC
jgi:hypothetical protein